MKNIFFLMTLLLVQGALANSPLKLSKGPSLNVNVDMKKQKMQLVREGGISSNGGDAIPPWVGSAWFADGNRPIQACFVKADHFSASEEQIRSSIKRSFEIWKNFAASRTELSRPMPNISFDVQIRPCDNSEDLKFYFGVTDARVRTGRQHFFEPLAFAYRESYHPFTWGKGLIWISDDTEARKLLQADWSTSDLLTGILLHEMGHVLGNDHHDETIMREDIVAFLRNAAGNSSSLRSIMTTSIDWGDSIWTPMGTSFNYEGVFVPFAQDEDRQKLFKILTGRNPKGKIKASFVRALTQSNDKLAFILSDDGGTFEFPLRMRFLSWVHRPGKMFRVFDGTKTETSGGPGGILNTAEVKGASGQIFQVLLHRGGAEAKGQATPASIRFINPWETNRDLFAATPGGLPLENDFR